MRLPKVRLDVEVDEALVALAGGVLQLGDVEPPLDDLVDGHVAFLVPLLVHGAEELCQLDLCLGRCVGGLPQVARRAGQWVRPGVDNRGTGR